MSDENPNRMPTSLDALLDETKGRFEDLFDRQMTASPPPVAPATVRPAAETANETAQNANNPSEPETPVLSVPDEVAPASADLEAVTIDLNQRFTIFWSSEVLEREIQNGRATVRCQLTVGEESRTESGSSRVGSDDDQVAAFERASASALSKLADQFDGGGDSSVAEPTELTESATASEQENALRQIEQHRPMDAMAVEQINTALGGICHLMQTVLFQRALSSGLRDHHADIALLADGQGRMVSGQTGSFIEHMISDQQLQFAPGDVLIQSDPYLSGGASSHLNDWILLAPVFYGSERIGFAAMVGHVSDVGGTHDGSMPITANSVFAEGLRIPPVKIVQAGEMNESVLDLVLNNSRTPDKNRADLLALIAGCRTGEGQMIKLCDRFGAARLQKGFDALRASSARAMRELIAQRLPQEPQSFEDQIDDDGCGNGPFRLKLTVWREADHAYFDWTGSAAQAGGPINFPLHVGLAKMLAGTYLARRLSGHLTTNDGFYDFIHVTVPKGSILNPTFPAAVGRRDHVLARVLDVISAAVRLHEPQKMIAAGYGTMPSMSFAGTDSNGRSFRLTDSLFGGLPGKADSDGMDGHSAWPHMQSSSAESLERNFSIVIESCASLADSGGAGLFRGGNGVEKVFHFGQGGELSISDDRHASQPWGVQQGRAGAKSEKWLVRADGEREALPAKCDAITVSPGDRLIFRTAGGGGFGDPLQRRAEDVLADWSAGLLTQAGAGTYGVVVNEYERSVNDAATRELREQLRRVQGEGN